MKSLDFLKQVDHSRKAAIYAAGHDGKLRNFAYSEELGECRETFSRLLHDVQEGEIGVILAPEAASLGIETSPGWMEAFIQAAKQHAVLIGDHEHDLAYDLREEEDEARFRTLFSPEDYERERLAPRPLADAIAQSPFAAAYIEHGENWFLVTRLEGQDADTAIYVLSSGALGQEVDLFGMGRWKEILEILAPYGISQEGGWCPVPPERKDWLSRTQRQEDAMAVRAGAAMEPHRGSLPQGAHVSVILPRSERAWGNKRRRRRGGRNR
jgi:hypothetical protein